MIWLQESWKEDHEKKDELNTSCKPPDETKAKKKRTKAWRFRKYQMERRNFVPRLRNVNVNLCFFPVFHFASLIYGNPLFGCYKGLRLSSSRLYIFKQCVFTWTISCMACCNLLLIMALRRGRFHEQAVTIQCVHLLFFVRRARQLWEILKRNRSGTFDLMHCTNEWRNCKMMAEEFGFGKMLEISSSPHHQIISVRVSSRRLASWPYTYICGWLASAARRLAGLSWWL